MSPRVRWPSSIEYQGRWRRYIFPLIVLAVAGGVSLCDRARQAPPAPDDHALYHDRSFRVARVVDGDTFDIASPDPTTGKEVTRIRLWGVDSPEVAHGGKPAMHFGPEARTFAQRTLSDRTVHVVLSPERTRGKYGRLLAYVYLERGGDMFNEMLLEQGYAYADTRFDHHYYDRFRQIEARARRASAGLWASVAPEQMPEWRQRFDRGGSNEGD